MTEDLDALTSQKVIDLTTTGRKTGRPRRIEIWWHHVSGRLIITGTPGPRGWLANIRENPDVTIHLDGRDIPARAAPVEDPQVRRELFRQPALSWYSTQAGLDQLVANSPMVEVALAVTGPHSSPGNTRYWIPDT